MVLTSLLAATMVSAPMLVETRISGASLFKNGYAVVVREAPMPAGGDLMIEDPPRSTLGTLWVTASNGVRIQSVVATTLTTDVTTDLATLDALITANVGKKLTISVMVPGKQEAQDLEATIKSAAGSVLVIETEDGRRSAFQKSTVVRISAAGGELVYQAKSQARKTALRVKGTGQGNVYIMSLERGLTWAPGYHVDITDPKRLTLTSKATVLNDLGKIENIDVKLITGFPNVRFINVADPLTSGVSVDQFVNSLMQMGAVAMDASPMTQNAFAGRMAESAPAGGGFAPFQPGNLEGLQLEDLFFYTLPKVTLDRGERGYYVQFQEQADYEHVYTLDLAETGWWQDEGGFRSVQPEAVHEVWHTLEFTNPSAFPLTTAAATTFKQGQIIGQDMLSYTAPKGKGILRITKALDIRPDLVEEEVSRQVAAIPRTNYTRAYDLVTAKGTIELINYKSETVKVKISKFLVGEVTSTSHGGAVTKNKVGLRAVNPNSEIKWTLDLKAGERAELTFDFKVYVPTP